MWYVAPDEVIYLFAFYFFLFQWEFIFVRHYVCMWFTSCMIVA